MRALLQHYIDGRRTASDGDARREVIDPATEEPCATVVLGTAADIDRAVAAARRALPPSAAPGREDRVALLHAVAEEYARRAPDLPQAMAVEMGAPISFAAGAQVGAGLSAIRSTIAALAEFAFSERQGSVTLAY